MFPKVSVVVPLFKVEKYMEKCVESILNQNYPNIELILVDDGSPDHCGQIADRYAALDNRIRALHKSNGGLSDARNYGMKRVTGEYTLFIDSDDWIAGDMIRKLVDTSLRYDADVVQSAFYYAYDDYLLLDNRYFHEDGLPVLLDNQSLMYELVVNEKVKNFAWGKLYKTKLVQDIPFEEGVLFEDVFWAHKVMHRVKKYVILQQPMYFYLQRSDSIVADYSPKNLDILKGLKERHSFIEQNYKELTNESLKMMLKTCFIHYRLLLGVKEKDQGAEYRRKIQLYIKKNMRDFKKAVQDEPSLKRQLFLFIFHPYLSIALSVMLKALRMMRILPQPNGLKKIELAGTEQNG